MFIRFMKAQSMKEPPVRSLNTLISNKEYSKVMIIV
jgi:hypothetical protein